MPNAKGGFLQEGQREARYMYLAATAVGYKVKTYMEINETTQSPKKERRKKKGKEERRNKSRKERKGTKRRQKWLRSMNTRTL